MLRLDINAVKKALEQQACKIEEENRNLVKARAKAKEWDDKISECEKNLINYNQKAKGLQNSLVFANGISGEILTLRNAILNNMRKAERRDIRVDTREETYKEIAEQILVLMEKCKHSFVLNIAVSYCGSRLNDYEDRNYGKRKCVVCNYSENSTSIRREAYIENFEDSYATLNFGADRFISDLFRIQYPKKPLEIWVPLEELLQEYFMTKTIRTFIPNS